MALQQTHRPGGRPAYDPYERRFDLYVKAAPVFRTFGYHQVTMKALAHACGVSAPALYRYFPSKLDFALFPLAEPPTGYCATLLITAADAHADPLRGLRAALEAAVSHADLIALAVGLAIEAGRDERDVFSPSRLDSLDATIRDVLLHFVPASARVRRTSRTRSSRSSSRPARRRRRSRLRTCGARVGRSSAPTSWTPASTRPGSARCSRVSDPRSFSRTL